MEAGGSIIEVEGIPSRFKTLYTLRKDELYAGILKDGFEYILYGVYKEKHKDTRREI